MPINKLTSWEWDALISECNLADGHAHQEQNAEQQKIINRLGRIFSESEKGNQKDIQREFEKYFFKLAGQHSYTKLLPPLYQYGCSLSIEAAANYLRMQKKSVTLIHPTFDNLADILKRHDINLVSIDENKLRSLGEGDVDITTDALFIVCPNNPTGTELTQEEFTKIVKYCQKNKILLIADFSFRFYSRYIQWDQYNLLQSSGIDFIIFEDTGKTWPTLDLKLGIMLTSKSLYSKLQDINNDFLLNVSPFIFKLLTKYISVESSATLNLSPQKTIQHNRQLIQHVLQKTPLKVVSPASLLSVEWIQLPPGWKSSAFSAWLQKKGIFVLPGIPFYWDQPKKGESYIRVALARPLKLFAKGATYLAKLAQEYQPKEQRL